MSTKALLSSTQQYITYFFDHFDPTVVDRLVEKIKTSQGLIFFTGVGKSGLVAQKIAVTMTSTGTRALFLAPTDSLHGDIGLVREGDLVFLLSKSGESDELLSMVPYLRNRGAILIAVVCETKSRLAKASLEVVKIPLMQELCPHDMAPTISTTSQLIFGDILAVALMKANAFSAADFALNHPAGRLGKRASMRVKDLMLQNEHLPLAHKDALLKDSLVELSNKRAGSLLIHDDHNHLLGIFTDGDLRRALQSRGVSIMDQKLSDMMTQNPKRIEADTLLVEALKIMEGDQKHPIMVLPVVDKDNIIQGLLKLHDIIQTGI